MRGNEMTLFHLAMRWIEARAASREAANNADGYNKRELATCEMREIAASEIPLPAFAGEAVTK